ncbi:HSP20-like chaperone [Westerdykella ornata]|uniref:HSP20-like chaperone n=1 Tax=Westerdykella ornata TaxID=318751 RepID=A0A6A6JFP7_WESOR|nr:HSP20-like chaperone [Westerdykella ornata]KAF2275242.1 HSP20-like chaperone [Westerdykella ornata]
MAFFLTPRFAPAYEQCGPFGCGPSRPRHVVRPSVPSLIPFLSQIDGLISELDREARRAAHQQRQQRKRAFRARFDVKEQKERYEVEGDVPGFEQENISIEVTDEHTLKVSGDTEKRHQQPIAEPQPAEPETDKMDGVTLNEEASSPHVETAADSDTESRHSYQPTVEDDFEDLGAETSSTISNPTTAEPKGKEKAVEEPTVTETSVQKQPEWEAPAQRQEPEIRELLSERVRGSFERTFQFPERIDIANVSASLRNGVLSISIPKAPAFESKRIAIQ